MIQFDKVEVRVSELQTTVVTCAPWETPILQAIYGEDSAEVIGQEAVDRKLPDPQDEFTRLAVRYGPKNAETPVVAAVYGNFGPGLNALRRAISACAEVAEKPLEVPELTTEQVAAIEAKYKDTQPELIKAIEPKPPTEAPSEEDFDPLAEEVLDEGYEE